jgi:hypothetical protein
MMSTKAMLAMAAPFLTPKIVGSTCGVLTLGIAGAGLMKWTGSKGGIEFRRKLATSIRDKAQTAIDKLEQTADELERTVQGKNRRQADV